MTTTNCIRTTCAVRNIEKVDKDSILKYFGIEKYTLCGVSKFI